MTQTVETAVTGNISQVVSVKGSATAATAPNNVKTLMKRRMEVLAVGELYMN